ncbi:MAG: class I SAM-dependent methyltransferase [Candidatus Colwellbacteria bacterium]|nr:class I SAM-dependent methyltransferase [Candidatus Colwellbacteria bacterium]
MREYSILESVPENGYELLDSGSGEKLERYGNIILSRPDPQALWPKAMSEAEWNKASAYYGGEGKGKWIERAEIPEHWPIDFGGLKFNIRLSAFKHTGIFPEHKPNWEWMDNIIRDAGRQISVLNLFGYTGGATLAAAKAGAEVCHLDGSKVAINWAKENAKDSGLSDKPIRWILDDAATFVKREIKRGHKYDGVIMDPPAFGHGPNGEMWKIEDDLIPFLADCVKLLSENPLFLIMNGYASGYSAVAYGNMVDNFLGEKGKTEIGELTITEKGRRNLPAGIFGRWKNQ